MATDVTGDQDKAFEEAYALSGVLVSIDAVSDIQAIKAHDNTGSPEFETGGVNQNVKTATITVKTADLPALTVSSVVTLDSVSFRIAGNESEGKICTTLELESP